MVNKSGTKRKKVEKTKVQFKKKTGPGLHLPKGTNVTKAEVKVAKIVIPNQITVTNSSTGPVTRRNLGMGDLLSKLGHFSQTVRLESLEGLKELLTGEFGGNLVKENLSLLISRIIPQCADVERKIRKNALIILQAILSKVDNVILEPLYPLMTAHLSCCLTNIQPAIQRDALPLIDTLVNTAPAFIAANFGRILPDCVRQISFDESSTSNVDKGVAVKKVGGGRSGGVANNVTDKIGSLEWRGNVLSRVFNILNCVCRKPKDASSSKAISKQATVNYKENLCFSLVPNRPLNHFNKLDLVEKSGNDPILEMVDKILPLILDSWIEATTKEGAKETNRKSFLTNEVYTLLTSAAGILENLTHYAENNNSELITRIREKYLTELNLRIFASIPYTSNNGKCHKENLQLCSVILHLSTNFDDEMLNKIETILDNSNNEGQLELQVFKQLLKHPHIDELTKLSFGRQLFEKSRVYKTGSSEWRLCLQLLGRMAETGSSFDDWVDTLPNILMATETEFESQTVLRIMLTLAQQRNPAFNKSYSRHFDAMQEWLKASDEKTEDSQKIMSFIHSNTIMHV